MREALPEPHWQRIESGLTAQGIPDTNGCSAGVESWIELKVVNRGNKVKLQSFQVAWLVKRARAGGRSYVAVRVQKPGEDYIAIWPGLAAREVKDQGLAALSLAVHVSSPPDYDSIRSVLFGNEAGFRRKAWA